MATEELTMTVTSVNPLKVIADGADTDSRTATVEGLTLLAGDRVQATIRTPRMPLVTEKIEEETA